MGNLQAGPDGGTVGIAPAAAGQWIGRAPASHHFINLVLQALVGQFLRGEPQNG